MSYSAACDVDAGMPVRPPKLRLLVAS